jgi:hypothetical protein
MLHAVHAFESQELKMSKFRGSGLHHLRTSVNAEQRSLSMRTQTSLGLTSLAFASDISPGFHALSILVSTVLRSKRHQQVEREV